MALPTSGALTLDAIHVEAGGTTGTTCSLNDSDIRGLTAASGRTINSTLGTNIDFADFYGASGVPASYTRSSITPASYIPSPSFGTRSYLFYENTNYTAQYSIYANGNSGTSGQNVQDSGAAQFVDSNGDTQTLVKIAYSEGFKNNANFVVTLLGHNVTSNWSLTIGSLPAITPGSNFAGTSGFSTWIAQSNLNSTVTDSSLNSSNVTVFSWKHTNNSGGGYITTINPLPNTSATVNMTIT